MKRALSVACVGLLSAAPALAKTDVYGFITANWEKSEKSQNEDGANSNYNPNEIENPFIHVMVNNTDGDYRSFLNINGGGAGALDVRNAWFEGKIAGEAMKYRIGKMYRFFDIYNEILDAVPTYIGIEPPELFDKDHLMVSRTTNFMLHGNLLKGDHEFRYSLTTGNDDRDQEEVPVGGDLRWDYNPGSYSLMVGTSFYYSGNTGAGEVGADSGVAAHMARDNYSVNALYSQFTMNNFLAQASFARAQHDATRSASFISDSDNSGNFNNLPGGRASRFCNGTCATAGNVITNADYNIDTWYLRLGYMIGLKDGASVTPYVQYDYYYNPEMIGAKASGGDNEAGWSDDGKFTKRTLGAVYRPKSNIAIKLDGSTHHHRFNGKDESYAEVRSSFAYQWSL